MSKMDDFLNGDFQERVLMFGRAELEIAEKRDELASLRARLAAAETPKTCATCEAYGKRGKACQNPFSPTYGLTVTPAFFCANHYTTPEASA